jgi:hypothetical protein
MALIDLPNEGVLSDNERAVIVNYDFEVRDDHGQFALVDPVVRKANRGKGARYVGGNLEVLLQQAVSARKAHDASMAAAPPPAKKGSGDKKKLEAAAAVGAIDTAAVEQPTPLEAAIADTVEEPQDTSPIAETESAATDTAETVPSADDVQDTISVEAEPSNEPADEIEVEELDDTGKRERKGKKNRVKKERAAGRYTRAAQFIVNDLTLIPDDRRNKQWGDKQARLAKLADMSDNTAGHCLEAWVDICRVLEQKGWLIIPGVTKTN